MEPLFTLVMPAYNHENYVQKAIESVFTQTCKNIQFIVINDGSKDQTHEKIQELLAKYPQGFEYINKNNEGVSTTLNLGLSKARGKYFYYLASDDMLLPDTLTTIAQHFEVASPSVGLIYCDVYHHEKELAAHQPLNIALEPRGYLLKKVLSNEAQLLGPSCFFRTESLNAVGGFKNGLPLEDFYVILKMTHQFEAGYLPQKLVLHRHHETNSANAYRKIGPAALESIQHFFKEYPSVDKKLYRQSLAIRYQWQAWVGFAQKDRPYALKNYLRFLLLDPVKFLSDRNFVKSFLRTLFNKFSKTIYLMHAGRSKHFYQVIEYDGHYKLAMFSYYASLKHSWAYFKQKKLKALLCSLGDYLRFLSLKYLSKNKTIIFSLEPFSADMDKIKLFLNRHKLIYQTSWPYWTNQNQPLPNDNHDVLNSWKNILSRLKIVTVTETAKAGLAEFLGKSTSIQVIPHAVDYSVFKNSETEKQGILFVGRFIADKNFSFLKELVTALPQYHFTFIGEGPEIQSLEQLSNITVVRFQPTKKLAEYYKKSKCLLLPSRPRQGWEELFGLVILEAMASRTVVLAGQNNVGPRSIISSGETGFLLPLNTESWIAKINDVMNSDMNSLLGKAEQLIKEKYDYPVVFQQWKKVLTKPVI
ncbi:MAG: glycosyltransferase [Candidatus Margulisbacteria bacterium]|nr:glycosyltransferase [Candidatus Margulisiibacteriota bacterium]